METINPNRMELSKQKKRLVTAKRGHKLLKDKQDALIRLFLEKVKELRDLRAEVENDLINAYASFLIAKGVMDTSVSNVIFLSSGVSIDLKSEAQNNMGVKTPVYGFEQNGNLHSYGLVGTSGELDVSLEIFSNVLGKLIKLSEIEKMVELMSIEIEKTRRRVNALEYRLIPQTEEIIRFIKMKLDEMERGNLSRLMRVKEIISET